MPSLSEAHRAELETGSAIAPAVIAERGPFTALTVDDLPAAFADWQRRPGLVVPIRDTTGHVAAWQLKADNPRLGKDGKPVKYDTAVHGRQCLDVPVRSRSLLGDPSIPLWITEGAKKVDAGLSHGIRCIVGVQGVYGWRGTNAHGGKTALPDWEDVSLNGRDVVLAFDSDVMTKAAVRDALERLSGFLTQRRAHVRYLAPAGSWRWEGGKMTTIQKCGLDDAFAQGMTLADLERHIVDVLPADEPPAGPSLITAYALMRKEFPEPRWAVPGIFPEGLSILGGPPKMGKSWLALAVAAAVAQEHGGRAIGKIAVEGGDALYLALEDTERRVQERLKTTLEGTVAPHRLHIATSWPTLAEGAAAHLSGWLASHPDARLVVVDTFQKLRGPIPGNQNLYAGDYAAAGELKRVADQFGVAVVIVHHTRKALADDPLDMVSGTTGLAGAADTTCVLRREIGRADATLYIRGRDVREADHALSFDAETCAWTLLGDASEYRLSEERREIVELLRGATEPLSPKRIAETLGKKDGAVRYLLHKMAKSGDVDGVGGAYRLPLSPTNTANSANAHGDSVESVSTVSGVSSVPTPLWPDPLEPTGTEEWSLEI